MEMSQRLQRNGANPRTYQQCSGSVQPSQEQMRCLHQATGENNSFYQLQSQHIGIVDVDISSLTNLDMNTSISSEVCELCKKSH